LLRAIHHRHPQTTALARRFAMQLKEPRADLGRDPTLLPDYAEIPRQKVLSLPHDGRKRCAMLHIVRERLCRADRSASGFQSPTGNDAFHWTP
jgi:hypothetical protein